MKADTVLHNLQNIADLLKNTPAQDIKQNMKAMLTQRFSKYGLVSREEFDIQTQVLARTRAKLEALERRMAQFEQQFNAPKPHERTHACHLP